MLYVSDRDRLPVSIECSQASARRLRTVAPSQVALADVCSEGPQPAAQQNQGLVPNRRQVCLPVSRSHLCAFIGQSDWSTRHKTAAIKRSHRVLVQSVPDRVCALIHYVIERARWKYIATGESWLRKRWRLIAIIGQANGDRTRQRTRYHRVSV